MQTNAEQANADLALMKQKVSMLETQCQELHKKDVEIIELRSCLEGLELQIVNHASEISGNEKLKKELDEACAMVEELQKEVQTNAKQANIELLMMKEKVSMLETQCEELNEKDVEIMELRSHVEQANVELSMTKHKVSMLETQCEEKGCKIEELGSHLASLELQNRNQALEISKVQELKKELEEAHVAMVEELQKEMQTNVEQANVELSMTKQKVSMLETQCEEKKCKIEELGSHLEGLELQSKNQTLEIFTRQKLQKELEEAHGTRIEELQKEMQTNVEQANAKLSMTKQKVAMLETQCEEKGSKIEELKSHIEVLELQNKNQTLEISTWQKLKKELEEAHVAMVEELQKEMQTNVEQANVELSMTKQKVSMLETQCQELHEKDVEILELKSHLEVVELQQKNQALEISMSDNLKNKLNEAHAKVEELETNMEQANGELLLMKQKVSMLETQCEEEKSKKDMDIQSNMYFLQEMEGEVVGLRHTNKELEQQKIELTERLLAAETKLTHHFEMEKVNIFAWKNVLKVKSYACIIIIYWKSYAIKCWFLK
jgi:chromosome segregation ATPase